jgi:hypothetical protein
MYWMSPCELTDDGKKIVKEVSNTFKGKCKEFRSAIFNIQGKIRKITTATELQKIILSLREIDDPSQIRQMLSSLQFKFTFHQEGMTGFAQKVLNESRAAQTQAHSLQ